MTSKTDCSLCNAAGGEQIFQCERFRVIRALEPGFAGFYRLIWSTHVTEFSDLSPKERTDCMTAVNIIEVALRDHLQPTKINIASLGNVVAHLHWHVIARFEWDSHYPSPVWGAKQREVDAAALSMVETSVARVDIAIKRELSAVFDYVNTFF